MDDPSAVLPDEGSDAEPAVERAPEPSSAPRPRPPAPVENEPAPAPTPVVAVPEVAAADTDPAAERKGPRPRFTSDPDTRRSRVLVLLRLPLAVPHLIWWWLWGLLVAVVLPLAWIVGVVSGRIPRPFHRLLRAYVRYTTHLTSFLTLAGNPFPGFIGTLPYPVDVHVPDPVRQPRLSLLVRWVVVLPALVVLTALDVVRWIVVPVAWLIALVAGRLPRGLVDVLAYAARWQALTLAYAFLLTRRYPTFGGDEA